MSDNHSGIEAELRDAVQSYGTSVQPNDRLGEIRRTAQSRSRVSSWQPWLLTAGAAAAAAAVVVGGVTLGSSDPPASQSPVAGSDQREVTVYEVREVGGRPWLYPEQMTVDDTGDAAYDAVLALVGDGSGDTGDGVWVGCDYGRLESVEVSADAVTVGLVGAASTCDMDPAYDRAQLQQLAWTVHNATGSDSPVVLENGGRPLTRQPISADRYALSPVLLDSPTAGATVTSPVAVEGRGSTFEGNVQWQVLSGDRVVEEGFETAGTMGTFRPFRFNVELAPGDYTVRAFELSAENGSLRAEDTLALTVG